MSRNATLSATLQFDLNAARQQYAEFLAWVAANQPKATLGGSSGGAQPRVLTSFGGHSVTSTSPITTSPLADVQERLTAAVAQGNWKAVQEITTQVLTGGNAPQKFRTVGFVPTAEQQYPFPIGPQPFGYPQNVLRQYTYPIGPPRGPAGTQGYQDHLEPIGPTPYVSHQYTYPIGPPRPPQDLTEKLFRAQMAHELSTASTGAEKAEIFRRYADQYEEGSADRLNLLSRGNIAGRRVGGRMGVRREVDDMANLALGRLGQVATVGYLFHSASLVGEHLLRRQDAIDASSGDTLAILRASQAAAQGVEQVPFLGPAAGLGARALMRAMGMPSLDVQVGLEERRRTDLLRGAERGDIGRQSADVARDATARSSEVLASGQYQRQLLQSRHGIESYKSGLYNQRQALIDRLSATQDPAEKARIAGDIRAFDSAHGTDSHQILGGSPSAPTWQTIITGFSGPDVKAQEQLARDTNQEVYRQIRISSEQQRTATAGQRDTLTGNYLRGAVQAINSKFNPQFDPKTGIVIGFEHTQFRGAQGQRAPGIADPDYEAFQAKLGDYTFQVAAAKVADSQRVTLDQGRIDAMQDVIGRRPLDASLKVLKSQRDAALAPLDPANTAEIGRINKSYDLQEEIAQQQERDARELIGIGLTGEGRSTALRLKRNPIGAQAMDIETSGAQRMTQLAQQGFGPEVKQSYQNTAASLDLLRQNYLDAFEGVQMDLRNIRPGENQKGSIDDVISAIKEAKESLKQGFVDALLEAVGK